MNGRGQHPTASGRGDLSPAARASGAGPADRTFSEADLWFGYSGSAESRLETLPCQCGGTVTADRERPAPGVAAHQFTSRHKAWRAAMGFD